MIEKRGAPETLPAHCAGAWLDAHFEACRPEYEAMLRSVGIEQGRRVLDAGCGSGSHLPLMRELVGPTGSITAIDLLPENIAAVQARYPSTELPPVTAQVAALHEIPFPDHAFDAVWCANVTQYLDDETLLCVLHEFQRVARRGGLVAIKDVDMELARIAPADPLLLAHLSEVGIRGTHATVQSWGSLRGRTLRRWLERAGFVQVIQQTTLIERWAPLRPVEHQFFGEWLSYLARLAEERGVPAADRVTWAGLRDPADPASLLNHPDFYVCEGQVVAVGRVPGHH